MSNVDFLRLFQFFQAYYRNKETRTSPSSLLGPPEKKGRVKGEVILEKVRFSVKLMYKCLNQQRNPSAHDGLEDMHKTKTNKVPCWCKFQELIQIGSRRYQISWTKAIPRLMRIRPVRRHQHPSCGQKDRGCGFCKLAINFKMDKNLNQRAWRGEKLQKDSCHLEIIHLSPDETGRFRIYVFLTINKAM